MHIGKIRVAELADRRRTILLAPRPQIAPRKTAEDRRAPGLRPFALQRVENLFDSVSHKSSFQLSALSLQFYVQDK
jgi:hypothetical protein